MCVGVPVCVCGCAFVCVLVCLFVSVGVPVCVCWCACGACCDLAKSYTITWSKPVPKTQLSSSSVSSWLLLKISLVHLFVPRFVPIILPSEIFH